MLLTRFSLAGRAVALALALVALPIASAQEFYATTRTQNYLQSSASAPSPDTFRAFGFDVEMPKNGTFTAPGGATIPLGLVQDGSESSYRLEVAYATKAALDAAYPLGTYTFSATGVANLSFNFTTDAYPIATPQITSGTWSNGLLVVDPAAGATLTLTAFTDYAGTSIGHFGAELNSLTQANFQDLEESYVSQSIFGIDQRATAPTSFTIPPGALTAGGIYEGRITFDKVVTADTTSVPGGGVVAIYSKSLTFYIVARAAATTAPAAPTVTLQPLARAVSPGATASVSFTAAAPGTVKRIMWFRNGVELNIGNGGRYFLDVNQNGSGLRITSFTAADAGEYHARIITDGGVVDTERAALTVAAVATPAATVQATATSVASGQAITLTATTGATNPTFQWRVNGRAVTGGTNAALLIDNMQPERAGLYALTLTTSIAGTTAPSIVGVSSSAKAFGAAQELTPINIPHPNGNIFDQVLMTGVGASITADSGQVTRTSFIDMDNDIVQVEFSGPGTMTIVLESSSNPAAPVNYNQPTVQYVKGHAAIVITGANEQTNVGVFSVGRSTAFDPTGGYNILLVPSATNVPANNGSSLFVGHQATVYGGMADIAFIAISSTNGRFGGLRASNATFNATGGHTGIYAPGVQFTGPVFVGDINAFDNAAPVFVIGNATDARITGGDLLQTNGRAVRVGGLVPLNFTAGTTSHGGSLPAQTNRARFEQNGVDVTINMLLGTP